MENKDIKLSIKKLSQSYNGKKILRDISLDVFNGETVAILGPSGCGKTSLLKSIAGLIPIDGGNIFLDGKPIEALPPQKRRTAMIFQNYALFPHMNVRENIEYGLKVNNENAEKIREKFDRIIHLLKLEGLENRSVTALSGGQQQRVAIGRAMIVEPAVLLFDEPLSNLDENLRQKMRHEIKNILRAVNITSIYVTHDQNEAMTMADRVVVMKEGTIEQIASPETIYYRPESEYVAGFLGYGNIFPAAPEGEWLLLLGHRIKNTTGLNETPLKVLIRPEDIEIFPDSGPKRTQKDSVFLTGEIIGEEILTSIRKYSVSTERGNFDITVLNRAAGNELRHGSRVRLELCPETFHFMKDEENREG